MGNIQKSERQQYDPRVTVEFNNTANNNEALLTRWLIEELVPVIRGKPFLLVWDAAQFHKTEAIKQVCLDNNNTLVVIPGGLTGEIQLLDTHING
jgi:hypothetical protein